MGVSHRFSTGLRGWGSSHRPLPRLSLEKQLSILLVSLPAPCRGRAFL